MAKKSIVRYFLLILAILPALYAALPLFEKRFIPTHDGEYHIIRFYEFFSMMREGYLFPRWAPNLNSGYGIPLFNFHYPLPNYVSSLLHIMGVSFVESFKLAEAAAYLGAVICCFLWLRKLFGSRPAVVGTIIFSYVPYWFVDLYVRGSIGEIWAIAWLLAIFTTIEYGYKYLCPVLICLLIISHNILAMLFLPLVFVYLFHRNRIWIKELVIGIGLSAYFWIPAIFESGYVTGLNIINFQDHFPELFQLLIPSWGTGFSKEGISYDEMSYQIGLISLVVIIWGFWLSRKENNKNYQKLSNIFFITFLLSAFLMLPVSLFFWKNFSFIQYIQYPWRFLSLIIPICSYFAAYTAYRFQNNLVLITIIPILSIVSSISYSRPVTYEQREDQYYLTKREFTDGTSSIANTFSTKWLPWVRERANQKLELEQGEATINILTIKPLRYTALIDASKNSSIRVNTSYYPGWNVSINDLNSPVINQKGVISFFVSPGTWKVIVDFKETFLRNIADGISLFCLFWLGLLGILKRYDRRNRHHSDK